jgi:hypothetical protein
LSTKTGAGVTTLFMIKVKLSILLMLFSFYAIGQELSNIGTTPIIKIAGGITLNQTYNWSDVSGSYSKPYAYTLAANLNLSIYGWSVPLSGIYSNRKWSYQQPFNQFSVNPSYKWIKLYIGYNSLSFSNYTLNGHRFFGGGIEITPTEHFKISAMAGRMQQRIFPDTTGNIVPAYTRFGSGLKTEYTFGIGNIAFSTFYAKDNPNSLIGYDSLTVRPAENLTMSLSGNISLHQNIRINAEYSTSIYTNDIQCDKTDKYKWIPFYRARSSTYQYNAIKTAISYTSIIGSLGLGYERVDPGYATLGAYSTVNDFVNYTFNYSGQVIPEKLTFATSIGLQQDNLNNTKAQKNQQWVGSANIGFTPAKSVSTNISYSNFRYYTHVKNGFEDINNTTPYTNTDTLDFTQISQSIGCSVSINPQGSEFTKHSVIISSNIQLASQQQPDNTNQSDNQFYNGVLGYTYTRVKENLSISLNMNYNLNKADTIKTTTMGPSLSMRKLFFEKKMNTTLSLSYNQNRTGNQIQSDVTILRTGAGYTMQNHNIDFNVVWAKRNKRTENKRSNDLVFNLTYRYNFKGFSYSTGKKSPTQSQNKKIEQ